MLGEDVPAERLHLAMILDLEPGTLQAQIKPTDTGKK